MRHGGLVLHGPVMVADTLIERATDRAAQHHIQAEREDDRPIRGDREEDATRIHRSSSVVTLAVHSHLSKKSPQKSLGGI